MAKRHAYDPILTKPLPSTAVPWLVILCLLACLVVGYKYFFGDPQRLLGGPVHRNEYIHYLHEPARKLAVPKPVPPPATQPAASDEQAPTLDGASAATSASGMEGTSAATSGASPAPAAPGGTPGQQP